MQKAVWGLTFTLVGGELEGFTGRRGLGDLEGLQVLSCESPAVYSGANMGDPWFEGRPGAWACGDRDSASPQVCGGHPFLRGPGAAAAPTDLHHLCACSQHGGPQRQRRARHRPHHRSVPRAARSGTHVASVAHPVLRKCS